MKFDVYYYFGGVRHHRVIFAKSNFQAVEYLEIMLEKQGVYADKRPKAVKQRINKARQ